MSAQPAPMNARRIMELLRNGLGAPLALMAMLAMLMVPLAAPVLDALFTFNIAISLMVLLAVVYVQRPLEFTIFPIVLLMTTMLRLALNVASSRVILINGQDGHAAAGKVIEAFGQFVIGGNYAVGIVVFAILTIINFVVITKGAGRVSEVTARFILDAMPGKQMAIDADLNAGLLTREEAKARREEVREEADFYGAMDGANKFIRGDAIAAILILFINLVGGMAVGMFQHGMSFVDAASTYTLLSIGDGLVAQLPALLVSSSVALLVTRASRAQDMRGAMISQVFGQHRALAVAAAILGLVGLVPGMPNVAFLTLGLILGVIAWKMYKRSLVIPPTGDPATDPKAAAAATAAQASSELSWDELRPIDPLGLEVGYRLIPLVDKNQGGELMARIKGVRRKLTQDIGFLVPPVHIRDNLELSANAYRLLVHGVPVATAEIYPDRELALDPGGALGQLDGIPGKDPAFGLDATWIQPHQRAYAESMGYTVVDPATVVATHLSHLIREHAPELLGHEEVQQLLATLAKTAPKMVEDLTPKALPLSVVVRVLQNLLIERIPVRQLRKIVEALVEHAPHSQDPTTLTAAVRTSLGRFIVQEIAGMSAELPVYTLAPQLERVLQESTHGNGVALEPGLAERLHQSLADCVGKQEARNEPAVVLVPGQVRAALARLVRHSVPSLSVLAYSEVPEDKRLKLVGTIS
ncbi:flagellar biosynthesis protein FlhA [Xanthomonas arboricola pv. juglandis]|jgi:flagellar biosynthesis protein FlhA|uniref:Flagellar biosynthesis protein FlhA n=5 Tax=Xanthomonas TaxID=338 RepID=A0AAP1LCY9_9XANT|nr:flagellar biosynthesis protein FlhA [Xanthomonas arboricola]MBB3779977.1 flagellar biosynthesis protein FlhA [Xanthomonas euroxanthea]MXV48882.1 flagellar biosynthesis protein FlhA [Xanthomonas sp. LMG 8993]PPT84332.1 flagellar biosynthesis protein FlhA [Xanthomonas arboricola pv. zantedeschiae]PPT91789.1 flagellar biosynthesis protein FlhA [Xanthomonas arboricola pv. arracaciae]QWM99573.1 flagellar biosynthesis protein FlhA [Xanthomonas sp. MLO165]CAD1791496.1 flagellar biosynthesis prote